MSPSRTLHGGGLPRRSAGVAGVFHTSNPTLRREGNEFYKAGDYAKAVDCYTEAIALDDTNHVYYSNRSMAHFAAGNYEAVRGVPCAG